MSSSQRAHIAKVAVRIRLAQSRDSEFLQVYIAKKAFRGGDIGYLPGPTFLKSQLLFGPSPLRAPSVSAVIVDSCWRTGKLEFGLFCPTGELLVLRGLSRRRA